MEIEGTLTAGTLAPAISAGGGLASGDDKAGSEASEKDDGSDGLVRDRPRDAIDMDRLLRSMGVTSYEPRVINQLMEFMHRHVRNVLDDAHDYREHALLFKPNAATAASAASTAASAASAAATPTTLTADDINLALASSLNATLAPPQRKLLHTLAAQRNAVPLPALPTQRFGVWLPADKHCLTAINYQIKPASAIGKTSTAATTAKPTTSTGNSSAASAVTRIRQQKQSASASASASSGKAANSNGSSNKNKPVPFAPDPDDTKS